MFVAMRQLDVTSTLLTLDAVFNQLLICVRVYLTLLPTSQLRSHERHSLHRRRS